MDALPWVAGVYNRELFLLLACHDFEFISPPALHMARTLFTGFGQRAVVENANSSIRIAAGHAGGGGIASRLTRFEGPHADGILKDRGSSQGRSVFPLSFCSPSAAGLPL